MQGPIDLEHLRRYTLGEVDLEREILGLFVQQAPLTLERLQQAESQRDWTSAAHTLKGSARAVGATLVGNLASSAEQLDINDVAARQSILAAIAAALAEANAYVCDLSTGASE